jgi:hypothetical protein
MSTSDLISSSSRRQPHPPHHHHTNRRDNDDRIQANLLEIGLLRPKKHSRRDKKAVGFSSTDTSSKSTPLSSHLAFDFLV